MVRSDGHRFRYSAAATALSGCAMALGVLLAQPRASAQPSVTRLDESTRGARVQAAVRSQVAVDQRVDAVLPGDVTFKNERGETVRLEQYFDGERPVLLNFAYYSCPLVCDLVLRETVKGLSEIGWTAGDEYRFVSVSIDPRDDAAAARETKRSLLQQYGRPGAEDGFHFLTGDGEGAKQVAEAVGWKYDYLPAQEEYAHPAAVVLLTPEGRVSRYLMGLQYDPTDLRVGLLEASEGRGLNVAEQAVVYCYRYDPESGGYVVVAENIMRLGGAAVAVAIAGTLGWLWRREFRRRRATSAALTDSKREAVRTS